MARFRSLSIRLIRSGTKDAEIFKPSQKLQSIELKNGLSFTGNIFFKPSATKPPGWVYDDLHKLRKYRNKVHIQDDLAITDAPRSESAAFSIPIVNWALELTVRVLNHLNEKFPRPEHLEQFAREISLPSTI